MITLTVPHADSSYDQRHGGPACWAETLTSAPRVWGKAGACLRDFSGRRSGDCAITVRDALSRILIAPDDFISLCSYYDLVAVTQSLTQLFFMLRQHPDGIVHVA